MKQTLFRPVALIAAGLLVSGMGGCKKQSEASKSATEIHTYTVRAEVRSLPITGDPRTEFTAKHQAIPEFVGPKRELGMDVMVMPFPLKDGVSLDGIAVGDKVEITFEVVYDTVQEAPDDYYVTRVVELPADTALDFTPMARPDAPAGK